MFLQTGFYGISDASALYLQVESILLASRKYSDRE